MAFPYVVTLGLAITSDGNYPSAAGVEWRGGSGTILIGGTFATATIKLQAKSPYSATWVDITDASFTAAGVKAFSLGDRMMIRAVVSGETTDSIDAVLHYNTQV